MVAVLGKARNVEPGFPLFWKTWRVREIKKYLESEGKSGNFITEDNIS